jgi:hypothetical protein
VFQEMGAPPKPLASVRRVDGASRDNRRPAGVTASFQVVKYSIEPAKPGALCNLFSKDNWRAALADEPIELGPQMPGISGASPLTCNAKRLAWARPGPDGPVAPPGEGERIGPSADPGEEVALPKRSKVVWSNIDN